MISSCWYGIYWIIYNIHSHFTSIFFLICRWVDLWENIKKVLPWQLNGPVWRTEWLKKSTQERQGNSCIQKFRCTEIQIYKNLNVQKLKSTKIQIYKNSDLQKFRYTKIQMYKNSGIQKFRYTKIQIYKNSDDIKLVQQLKQPLLLNSGEFPV